MSSRCVRTWFAAWLAAWLVIALSAITASAQDAPDALIHLQTGVFDPLEAFDDGALQAANVAEAGQGIHLVQFIGPVEAAWVQQVEALGGEVVGYVPANTHIVRMAPSALANVRSLAAVRWAGPYLPQFKRSPAFGEVNASAMPGEVELLAFPGTDRAALNQFLTGHGATILATGDISIGSIWRLRVPAAAVDAIVQHPDVGWIEPYVEPSIANAKGRQLMGVETVWQDLGYYGSGQIVAVSDSGLSVEGNLSQDFAGRLLKAFPPSAMNQASPQCTAKTNWTDLNGHGTHVAGSVLGNGQRSGSDPAGRSYASSHAGAAPEAQLVFMALNTDGSTGIQCIDVNGDFIAKGYTEGARISSNSWGASDRGGYNLLSSIVDDYVWRHKDYLVLFAAGNAGSGAQTIGSPGTAKNTLTIGASENNRPDQGNQSDDPATVAGFSSRGPTADGRIKPDIVSPGTWILSVRAAQAPDSSFWGNFDADYAYMGGTSMATPLTAGAAALVREWLGKARNIANPSAALLKAIMINGALQLESGPQPSMNSGYGRTDVKNTLNGQYAVVDDYAQGLRTGDTVSYTVQLVAAGNLGVLAATVAPTETVVGAASATLQLEAGVAPAAAGAIDAGAAGWTVAPLPTSAAARTTQPLPTARDKASLAPLSNPLPSLPEGGAPAEAVGAGFHAYGSNVRAATLLQQMVGGGDFEDPDWSDYWRDVWLGTGVPLRTDDPSLVINGSHSVWLGGTPVEDAIWYPLSFPAQIDNSATSYLAFNVNVFDQDPDFDYFCVGITDIGGDLIGPFAPDNPDCQDANGQYTYTFDFTAADLDTLEGQTGYLVLYTLGDAAMPHMSAIVDDIALAVDFPDVTLQATPASGPPGTEFLLTGDYNVPYSAVDICIQPCSNANYIGTVYADDRGSIAAYLYSSADAAPGIYTLETLNVAGRKASTTVTLVASGPATLDVAPATGPAGTRFEFTGSGFLPFDNQIAVEVGGEFLGTTGSNGDGEIAFALNTQSNTPPGPYAVSAADDAGNRAETTFTVTVVPQNDPALSVTPASAPAGTTFVFTATNFTPSVTADVLLDGQAIGTVAIDATGAAPMALTTGANVAPGPHTLLVRQSGKEATASFEITGGGSGGESGSALRVTLAWVDPPAQASAARTLINDLDLTVQGPGGPYFGNGGSGADRRNNVEAVRLQNPQPGAYVITVRANSVNATFGAQPFALVATTRQNFGADTNNVDLTTPAAGGVVSGTVYSDIDLDGTRDSGEPGIPGVRLTAWTTATGFAREAVTDTSGAYRFGDLPANSYLLVAELPAGMATTGVVSSNFRLAADEQKTIDVGAAARVFMPVLRR